MTAIKQVANYAASKESGDSDGRTSSSFGAGFNVVCCIVGAGLLQLPWGVSQSGWVGVPILILMCVMATYTGDILIKCLDIGNAMLGSNGKAESSSPMETYGDIGEAAFGKLGRWIVNVQMHLTLTLVATVYNLIAGLNLMDVFSSAEWLTPELAIIIVAGVLWFHVFLKTLGEVAIVSAFNFAITLVLLVVVIAEAILHEPSHPVEHIIINSDATKLGGAFASFAFAFGVHPILPTVYRSMRKPKQYRTMFASALVVVMLFYLPMVFVCYGIYGNEVKSPIYDTLELRENVVMKVVVALLTVHVIAGYAIVINPVELALEAAVGVDDRKHQLLWRVGLRSLFVVFSCCVSVVMRTHFPPLLELVSSFTSTFTQFILPCAFYIKISLKANLRIGIPEIMWNILIIAIAVFGSVFGFIGAIKDIAAAF